MANTVGSVKVKGKKGQFDKLYNAKNNKIRDVDHNPGLIFHGNKCCGHWFDSTGNVIDT